MKFVDCSNDNFETALFRIIRSFKFKFIFEEIQCGKDAWALMYTMRDFNLQCRGYEYDGTKIIENTSVKDNVIEMVYNNLNEGRQVVESIELVNIAYL